MADDAFNDIRTISSDTTDKNDKDAITFMILTMGKVVEFGESVNESDLQKFTETIEYILRVKNAMADINGNDQLKLDEFVDTQGDLMEQIARKAYLNKILSKYGPNVVIPEITWV